jgi:hypothetical protein
VIERKLTHSCFGYNPSLKEILHENLQLPLSFSNDMRTTEIYGRGNQPGEIALGKGFIGSKEREFKQRLFVGCKCPI